MALKSIGTWSLAIALVIAAAACSRQPAATSSPPAPRPPVHAQATWDDYAARFIEEYFKAQPFFAVQAGRHEFDGRMADLSAAGIAREVEQLKTMRTQAEAFNEASLTSRQRFQREYLLSVIDNNLFWLDRARFPFTNPAWYIDRLDPEVYLSRNYAPLEKRLRGYIGYARAIPQIAAAIRANLRMPLAKSLIERGIAGFGGFAEFFRNDVPKVFAPVQDVQAQKELAEANGAAAQAMEELKLWLEAERKRATADFALGEPLYLEMLQATERVAVPIRELLAVGRADRDRNTQVLTAACAQYLPQGTLRACVEKMNADKPQGGAVAGARAQLADLKAFIIAKRIVTVPGNDEVSVAEAPAYNRGNFA